ncbi:MAG TPA: GGDEF domain-containing protein [Bordetella sp.]
MLNSVSILIAVMSLANLMSVAIFGSLRHAGIPGVGRWMAANTMAFAALILFALRDVSPVFLTVVVGNALFSLSSVLGYEGCRQFFRLPPVTVAPYVGCVAVTAGIVYWTYVSPDIDIRVVIVSIFFGCTYGLMGWTIWRGWKPGRSFYCYGFVLAISGIAVLASAARALVFGVGLAQQQTLLLPSSLNIAFLMLGMLALPGVSSGMVMLAHDRMAERLERWANLDELTGALTRRGFFARMRVMVERTRHAGGVLSAAVVDLDHFKSINDLYGHATGDRVLAHVGQLVASTLAEDEVFGRLGGEEFALLFPGVGKQEALARLESLREVLLASLAQEPAGTDAALPGFTFSAGMDEYRHGESPESLMLRADTALYAAKARGRDRIVAADAAPDAPGNQAALAADYAVRR